MDYSTDSNAKLSLRLTSNYNSTATDKLNLPKTISNPEEDLAIEEEKFTTLKGMMHSEKDLSVVEEDHEESKEIKYSEDIVEQPVDPSSDTEISSNMKPIGSSQEIENLPIFQRFIEFKSQILTSSSESSCLINNMQAQGEPSVLRMSLQKQIDFNNPADNCLAFDRSTSKDEKSPNMENSYNLISGSYDFSEWPHYSGNRENQEKPVGLFRSPTFKAVDEVSPSKHNKKLSKLH